MVLTAAGVAAVLLVLWGVFHWLGIFGKTRVVLALLAAVGLGGFLGHALVRVTGWLQHAAGMVTGWAFGVSVPGVLFLVLAVLLIHDLHPGHPASRWTSYVAFGTGTLLVAGVTGIPALAPLAGALQSLLTAIAGFINSL
jgi:hypothetical protein